MNRKQLNNSLIVVIVLLTLTACSNNSSDKAAENAPVAMIATPGIDKSTVNTSWSATGQSQSEPMIIKTGTLSLEVADIDSTYTEIMTVASQYGGYVLRTDIDRADSKATIVITVAAAQFETAMIDLRALGLKVQQDTATGEDVTTQYVDLESRLHRLEATRERILTFLDQARNVEEAIQVNDRLSEIETQIEQIRGQMNYLEGRAAQSTITVYLYTKTKFEEKKRKAGPPVKLCIKHGTHRKNWLKHWQVPSSGSVSFSVLICWLQCSVLLAGVGGVSQPPEVSVPDRAQDPVWCLLPGWHTDAKLRQDAS